MCLHRSPSASLQREANLAGTLERITLLALKMDNTSNVLNLIFYIDTLRKNSGITIILTTLEV